MPFYDFSCPRCGSEFNLNASIKDMTARAVPCPRCGATDIERVYKGINVRTAPKAPKAPSCPNSHVCGAHCSHRH